MLNPSRALSIWIEHVRLSWKVVDHHGTNEDESIRDNPFRLAATVVISSRVRANVENIEKAASNGSRGLNSSMLACSKVPFGTCFRLSPIMTEEKSMPCSRRALAAIMLDVGFPVPQYPPLCHQFQSD